MGLTATPAEDAEDGAPDVPGRRPALGRGATVAALAPPPLTAPVHEVPRLDHGATVPPVPASEVRAVVRPGDGSVTQFPEDLSPPLS